MRWIAAVWPGWWLVAIWAVLFAATRPAFAVEGFACQHTSQCSNRELCVAESPTSTWGICRRITVLP